MQIVFSDESLPNEVTKSIFLAGPSPRSTSAHDWKQVAAQVLDELDFNGTVFIPVPRGRFYDGSPDDVSWTYDGQVAWELAARQRADIIVFYVDRILDPSDPDLGMPGFTTNIEFGEDLSSGKIVYGRPSSAKKCRYLDQRAEMLGLQVHTDLRSTLSAAIQKLGAGAHRVGGEAAVPLFIWETEQFQSWIANVKAAGNRLDDAKLLHHVRFQSGAVFCYTLWVNVWVEAEQRSKSNEFVYARKDASAVVAYRRDESGFMELVLVKEFRSPVSNPEGFVYELPGGSSMTLGLDPRINAQHELDEEVGLKIEDAERFEFAGQRQLVATMSSHQAQVYSIKLTAEEMAHLKRAAAASTVFGEEGTSEKTYVIVTRLQDLFNHPVDYSTIGMIFKALKNK